MFNKYSHTFFLLLYCGGNGDEVTVKNIELKV